MAQAEGDAGCEGDAEGFVTTHHLRLSFCEPPNITRTATTAAAGSVLAKLRCGPR